MSLDVNKFGESEWTWGRFYFMEELCFILWNEIRGPESELRKDRVEWGIRKE